MASANAGPITGSELLRCIQGDTQIWLTRAQVSTLLASTTITTPRPLAPLTTLTGQELFRFNQRGTNIRMNVADFQTWIAGAAPSDPVPAKFVPPGITGDTLIQGSQGVAVVAFFNNEVNTLLGGATAPGAPTINTVTPGNTQNSVAFTAGSTGGSAITGYKVERKTTGSYSTIAANYTSGSAYVDTGLTNGTSYTYRLSAINAIGTGPVSNELSGTPTASASAPPAPTIASVTPSSTQNSVAYTPGSDGGSAITSYKVERKAGLGSFSTIAATYTGGSPYVDTGLTNGTAYTYRVSATNAVGTGATSNEFSGAPSASAPVLTAYTGQIWTRSFEPNKARSGATSYTSITRHVVADNPATQQLIFPGYYFDDSIVVQPTGAYTTVFTVEQPIGTVIGNGSASVPGGGVDSSPATITYVVTPAAGSQVVVRQTITTASSGVLIPYTSNSGGDQRWTDETTSPLYPISAIGSTTKPSFVLGINSRSAGNGSVPDSNGNVGELSRSVGSYGYAWSMIAVPSESIDNTVRNRKERLRISQYCSHIWFNGPRPGGTATAAQEAGITLGNLKNAFQIWWDKSIGVSTCTPKPTDYTTPDPLNTSRVLFNTSVLALGSPVRTIADISHVAGIDPTDNGLWQNTTWLNATSGGNPDFTHETDAGYTGVRNAIVGFAGALSAAAPASQNWTPWRLSSLRTQDAGAWATPNDPACLNGASLVTSKNNSGAFRQTGASTKIPTLVSVLSGTAQGFQFDNTQAQELSTSTSPRQIFSSVADDFGNARSITGGLMLALIIPGAALATTKGILHVASDAPTSSRFQLAITSAGVPRITIRRINADTATARSSSTVLTPGTPVLLVATTKTTATSDLALRINGAADPGFAAGAIGTGTDGPFSNVLADSVWVGSTGSTNYSNDTIIEWMMLPFLPTTLEIQKIEAEIMWRYGLQASLVGTNPYSPNSPSSASGPPTS